MGTAEELEAGGDGMEEAEDELKRLIQALKQSEERFQMMSHAMDDAMWDWDLVHNRLWWGESFYTLFQYRPEDMEPGIESWSRRIHPEDLDRVTHSLHACLSEGKQRWSAEYRFMGKDGLYRSILDRGFVQYNSEGKAIRMVGAMVDVTTRRKLEAESARLNAELEKRVEVRTREIASAREALEAFSYSVSHDLRAPLRHITGFLQLLMRNNFDRLDAEGKRYLTLILKATHKMAHLIDALLSFARLGQGTLRMENVDVSALVTEVIQGLGSDLGSRQVLWKVHPLPEVQADATLLRQVFYNLIDNALKYTRLKPVSEIEIGAYPKDGQSVFFVKDNGVGFDMQYAHKLFCVFQRLHSEREFEGHGIGLANVKRIISRHGGQTWAEAKEGQGTTLYFSLPQNSERPANAAQSQTTAGFL